MAGKLGGWGKIDGHRARRQNKRNRRGAPLFAGIRLFRLGWRARGAQEIDPHD